jgi:hypothetical protein
MSTVSSADPLASNLPAKWLPLSRSLPTGLSARFTTRYPTRQPHDVTGNGGRRAHATVALPLRLPLSELPSPPLYPPCATRPRSPAQGVTPCLALTTPGCVGMFTFIALSCIRSRHSFGPKPRARRHAVLGLWFPLRSTPKILRAPAPSVSLGLGAEATR